MIFYLVSLLSAGLAAVLTVGVELVCGLPRELEPLFLMAVFVVIEGLWVPWYLSR